MSSSFFHIGGTLAANAQSYVTRAADAQLFTALAAGEFCYVLTARQMGKSSLMNHTAARLRTEAQCVVAIVDLTNVGQNLTIEAWYASQLRRIGKEVGLEKELPAFFNDPEIACFGPFSRWMLAIEEVLLPRAARPVVIFIDEIDIVLSLPFSTDEFFAGIRECYNRRTQNPALNPLTFCLLGVASPSDLIQDTRNTPFNIGRAIELSDFTPTEAAPLAHGLERKDASSQLTRALHWTGGHPYLTQRLCQALAEHPDKRVDTLCQELFLSHTAQERDDNLVFVRERLLRSKVDRTALLELYKKVLSGKPVPDTQGSTLTNLLRLAGLVTRASNGNLRPRNRLYREVFNKAWIRDNMPNAELQRQKRAFRRGLFNASLVGGPLTLSFAALAYSAIRANEQVQEANIKTRRQLFLSDVLLAQQAYKSGDLKRVKQFLDDHGKTPEEHSRVEYGLLASRLDTSLQQMPGLPPQVLALSALPDGTYLIGARERLEWWPGNGQPHQEVWLPQPASAIAFAPSARLAAITTSQGQLFLWTGGSSLRELPRLSPKPHVTNALAFSKTGDFIAVGNAQGELGVLDTHTYQWVWKTTTGKWIESLAFTPDSKQLAVGGFDGELQLWQSTGKPLGSLTTDRLSPLSKLAFSPNGKQLAALDRSGMFLLDLVRKREILRQDSEHRFTSLAFSASGDSLFLGGADQCVTVWDITGHQKQEVLRGHLEGVSALALTSGGNILSSGEDQILRLWHLPLERKAIPRTKHRYVLSCAISADGKRVARFFQTNRPPYRAELLDAGTGTLLKTAPIEQSRYLWAMEFSPDGNLLATGSGDGTLALWDANTGQLHWRTDSVSSEIHSVAFSQDGKHLAMGDDQGRVRIHHQGRKEALSQIQLPQTNIEQLRFSRDGRGLWIGSSESDTLTFWEREKPQPGFYPLQQKSLAAFTASPGGDLLVTAGKDKRVALRDSRDGSAQSWLVGAQSDILAVALSPDNRTLAVSTEAGIIQLWDTALGSETLKLEVSEPIIQLRFSQDRTRLVGVTQYGQIVTWPLAIAG